MTRILNYLQNKTKFADLCCVKPEIQAFHSHGIVKNVTNPPFLGAQYKKHDQIVCSSAQNMLSKTSEFCSQSKPDSARSPLKVAEISL